MECSVQGFDLRAYSYPKKVGIYEFYSIFSLKPEPTKNMKYWRISLLLVFVLCFKTVSAQENELIPIIENILKSNFDTVIPTRHFSTKLQNIDTLTMFKENLSGLQLAIENEQQFSGSITFGLNSQEVKRNNFFVINTGIDLSAGTYPFKFELSSGVLAQIENGTFSESVSALSISFDYNYSEKNLSKQSYVFLNGTNNSYLGIDQRYELGGGFILNYYSGTKAKTTKFQRDVLLGEEINSGLTLEGKEKLKQLLGNAHSIDDNDEVFKKGVNYLSNSKASKDEKLELLDKERRKFINTIIKNFSTTRLTILAGLNYELEKTADSLELYNGDILRKGSFSSTNRFRWVVRPGVEFRGENFKFSSKAYFKFGVFEEFYNEVAADQNIDKKIDYWSEWNTSLRFNFTPKIGITISYTLFYDNAPNRSLFNVGSVGAPDIQLFSAENKFKSILLSFNYGL